MLEQISSFIIHLIQTFSYFGVFFLMMLESAFIPIPSEITLPFAGFLAQQGAFNFTIVVLSAIAGDVIGTLIAYAVGFFLEETVIIGLIEKYGKFILLTKREYDHVMHWFQKHGAIIIMIGKLLPGFRTIIGLPAGLAETPLLKTVLYTLIGSAIWCTAFTYAGYTLGNNWKSLDPVFRKFEIVIVVVVIAGILWYVNHKLKIVKFSSKRS